jgi:regulator of protease activity HflC (stomatin/prohibitin superfamily)
MMVDAFWFTLSPADQLKDLSDLTPRGNGLDPAVDGALLTGDRAIMNMLLQVQYRIQDPAAFVRNVVVSPDQNEDYLLQAVIQNAAVASAARSTADTIWKRPEPVVEMIQSRAQDALDDMQTGIQLEMIKADKTYFPLQVAPAVFNVSDAENKANAQIYKAQTERQQKLYGAAGDVWEALIEEIEKLDQMKDDDPKRKAVFEKINTLLVERAGGEAGRKMKEAEKEFQRILESTRARNREFELLLGQYQANPRLFRERLLKQMLMDLYALPGVTKWILPEGAKQLSIWLNQDPVALKEAHERSRQQLAEQPARQR